MIRNRVVSFTVVEKLCEFTGRSLLKYLTNPLLHCPTGLHLHVVAQGAYRIANRGCPDALHVAHYNFVRVYGSLKVTPAMAVGMIDELWTIEDLYDAVME